MLVNNQGYLGLKKLRTFSLALQEGFFIFSKGGEPNMKFFNKIIPRK
jgi:hypothetical protein